MKYLFLIFIILISCTPSETEETKKNFDFDESQLGKIQFLNGDLDFGPTPNTGSFERLIEIKNNGKLAVKDFEFFFEGEDFSPVFRFSGLEGIFPGQSGTCTNRLEPEETCLISLSYTPIGSEQRDEEFKIVYKDGLDSSESTMRIKTFAGTEGVLTVTPDLVDFGVVDFNTLAEVVVDFENSGELEIRDTNFLIDQDVLTLFTIDFTDPRTNCTQGGTLPGGTSCQVVFKAFSGNVSIYDNYNAFYQVTYRSVIDLNTIQTYEADLKIGVFSLEGVLEITPILDYKTIISGSQQMIGLQVRNTGYNDAILKSFSTSAAATLFDIDFSNCTNLSDEDFAAPNEPIVEPGKICVLNATLSPATSMVSQALNFSDLLISYDNNKTGIVNTPTSDILANVVKSGELEVLDDSDNPLVAWSIPSSFVSGDSRISESVDIKLSHIGETVVSFRGFEVVGTGHEYISITESCPESLSDLESCGLTLTMNPSLSVYQSTMNSTISASLKVDYFDESVTPQDNPIERSVYLPLSGNLDIKSQLVFEKFDSTPSAANIAVANSAVLEKVYIRNIGALPESTFSIQSTNAVNFSAVNTNIIDGDGIRNCLDMSVSGDSLNPQEQCFYEMRSLAAANGSYETDLTISFGSGNVSDVFDLATEVVNPAEISVSDASPGNHSSYYTYNGSYPGPGSSTSTASPLVSRKYSNLLTVDQSQVTTLPINISFDLAVVDGAYGKIGESSKIAFHLKNIGEYPLGVNSVSIVEIFDEDLGAIVGSGATYDSSSGCQSGTSVNADSDCDISLDLSFIDDNRKRALIEVRYTLGDKASPDDVNFIEYTSTAYAYFQGYDSSTTANINFYKSAVSVSNLELTETAGPENKITDDLTFQNDGTANATDIHIALLKNGEIQELTGGSDEEIEFDDFTAGSGNLSEYFRLGTSTCSNASGNDIFVTGNCTFDLSYLAKSEGETEYEISVRFFNGVTYESDSIALKTIGLTKAKLEVQQILGAFPIYSYDFGNQVINETHTHEIEIKNTGETRAENINWDFSAGKFSLENNSNEVPTCSTGLDAGESCYLFLNFDPIFADIGSNVDRSIFFDYETGERDGGSELTQIIELNAKGFTENIRSKHYGWDEIYSIGFNQDFADTLNANPANSYDPEDLGFISFSWYSMDDVDGAVDRYLIFKSNDNDIDIYNDTPHAIITPDGSSVYSYVDENIINTPLRVWFYKVIPEKGGAISNILEEDYPVSNLRIVIPNKFESLIHKYMMNREICKSMDLTDTTLTSFDPESNGCIYPDKFNVDQFVNHNYDTTVEMFETSSDYYNENEVINTPDDTPVDMTFDSALAHCESKEYSFNSTNGIFLNTFRKTLPNRIEHLVYSAEIEGQNYNTADCVYDETTPLTGEAVDCQSKFLIELPIGGIPEWSTSRVTGFGVGQQTNYNGFSDDLIKNKDFTANFNTPGPGANTKVYSDAGAVSGSCFDLSTGFLEKMGPSGCDTYNLAEFTLDSNLAGPRVIDASSIDSGSKFTLWLFNTDISAQGFSVNTRVGGGNLPGQANQNNSSRYTAEFLPSLLKGGARCVTRIGY